MGGFGLMGYFGRFFSFVFMVAALAGVFGIQAHVQAQDQTEGQKADVPEIKTSGPRIQFEAKTHDFGKTEQKKEIKHAFTFKNVGDDVLKIEKVKAG